MSAFELGIEQSRVNEAFRAGTPQQIVEESLKGQLRSVLTERTQNPANPFELLAIEGIDGGSVTARGFEHRGQDGDLGENTYTLSVKEAADEKRAERFRLENQGYDLAKEQFFKLPLYSTVVLMSPPPEVPIEGYPGYNLMYFYHILPGEKEGQRTIKALSFINRFSKVEQAEILQKIDPEKEVEPTESSILLSPVSVEAQTQDASSFREMWKILEEVYARKERDFTSMPVGLAEKFLLEGEAFWKDRNRTLDVMMAEVANDIVQGKTEDQIKDKWAIMFNLADRDLLHQDFTKVYITAELVASIPSTGTVFDHFRHLAEVEVREAETSCGASGGMGINELSKVMERKNNNLMNPLAKLNSSTNPIKTETFTVEEAKNDPNLCKCGAAEGPHFHCDSKKDSGGTCRQEILVGRGIKECPSCHQESNCP